MIVRSAGTASRPVPTPTARGGFDDGSAENWETGNTGGTGTVVVTTLTANHVTGTFSCDAPPNGTSTAAALHVTSGTFDLSF